MRASIVIEEILRDYPKARNSDRYLQLAVWHRMGFKLTEEQRQKFMDMPTSETIRRIRQKLQEQGKYTPSPLIAKERKFKSHQVQQRIRDTRPDKIEPLLDQREVEAAKKVVEGQTKLI